MINFKKLLAGTLSAAMVLGTMAIPAFADETNTIDYKQFIQNVISGNGTYDGNGVTVKWSAESGCFDTRENHTCTVGNATATAQTPTKVNSKLAQFFAFDEVGIVDVNITNVKFVYEKSSFTICANSGWAGTYTEEQAPSAQFYLLNSGNVTVKNCTFDNVVLTTRDDNVTDKENRKVEVSGSTFKNIPVSYGIKDVQAVNVEITNNEFIDTKSGVMLSGVSGKNVKNINVSKNTFSCNGSAQEGNVFQIAANCTLDENSNLSITDNTSTTDTPVFRLENKNIANMNYSNNTIPETAPATSGESQFGATFGNGGNLAIQDWSGKDANVKVGEDTYKTLVDALKDVYKSSPTGTTTIECKANADVGAMTHGHVADDIIINGNGAYVSSGERDLEVDQYKYSRETGEQAADGEYLTKDVNVVVNNLNGIAAWGTRNTDKIVNLEFNDCQRMSRIYINGTKGTNNIVLNNCSFDGTDDENARPVGKSEKTSVYSNAPGTITVKNCKFNNIPLGINCNNKSNGAQTIKIDNCTFTDCGTTANSSEWNGFAAPIRVVTSGEGATTDVTVENADISYTGTNANVGNGDILLGAKDNSNPNVILNIKGTAAEIQTQYHDKDTVTTRIEETESRTLKMTSAPAKVKAVFEESTDEVENGKAYDLYIEADGEIINRLTSAHFTFALETKSGAIEYAVKGADNVNVTGDVNNVNRYLFNFDGTKADATDRRIKLGQIVFTGVGTFDFKITTDDNAENVVNATELVDNIVKSYVAAASADDTLGLGNGITDGEIKQETANLTVNVSFPNAVVNQAAAYQDMKVTVSGNGANEVVKLGEGVDGVTFANDTYTVEFTDKLVKGNTYTVTVEGAGYRTARYTVSMTGAKTLNFWNNVKTAPMVIEKDSTGTGVNTNFLAGDIVKDGQINIYDLSAVVSYFGTDNLVENHKEYAKYDLNRDGVIDSKDVAYVLVSWGK